MSIRTHTAAQLMSTDIKTVNPEQSLRDAARSMNEHGIRCLLVPASEPGRAPGIITGKDIVQLLGDADAEVLDELTVADAMSHPAITIQEDMCVADAINFMRMTGVRRVFVLRSNTPVGILSFTDVLRALMD